MLTNLLDLENNLSVRDVHKEEKSSKRSKEQEKSRKKKASRVKNFLAELQRAKCASGAPWVRKFGKPPSRENLVIT